MSKTAPTPKTVSDYEIPLRYYDVEYEVRGLSGKILTIIDASIAEKQQNKALKDLIKAEFYKTLFKFQKDASNGNAGHSIDLEDKTIPVNLR